MTDEALLGRLKTAVEQETPDRLDSILLRCAQADGAQRKGEPDMTHTAAIRQEDIVPVPVPAEKKRRKGTFVKWAAGVAAALVLFFGVGTAQQYYAVDSVISLDVNPSISLRVNQNEKVLAAEALNDDAVIVLDGMNLRNVDLDVAVNALIGSMLRHGYVDEMKNSILISVENADAEKGAQLQQRLSDEVTGLLDAYAIGGAVLSQTVAEDEQLKALADEHGITTGKAALVEQVVKDDERLTFSDIAALPINDINLLISNKEVALQGVSSSGQASSSAYIGEEAAASIALADAGVSQSAVLFSKTKLDFDDGRMVYEVEFDTAGAEYDYEIDATTGQIVERDIDYRQQAAPQTGGQSTRQTGSQTAPQTGTQTTPPSGSDTQTQTPDGETGSGATQGETYIGESRAQSIALGHAGLSAAEVTRMKVELERDDGKMIYDVEFKCGNIEYEYEIDATSGAILDFDSDYDD